MRRTRNSSAGEEHTVLFAGEAPVTASEISDAFDDESTAVTVIRDGRRAIQWLTEVSEQTDEQRLPDTVFLTSRLASPAWPTLLHALTSSPRLWPIPVVVLTDDETDAETAYALGGNAHVTVPESPGAYGDCLEALSAFWTEWAHNSSEYLSANHV